VSINTLFFLVVCAAIFAAILRRLWSWPVSLSFDWGKSRKRAKNTQNPSGLDTYNTTSENKNAPNNDV